MRGLVLLLVTACSGGYGVDGPREPEALRLVECTPAQPLFVEIDGRVTTHGRLDGEGMGWAGGGATKQGRRIPSLSFSMPSTSGTIDSNAVDRVVRTRKNDIQKCFEREMVINPSLQRLIVSWRFSIAQDGHVIFANASTRAISTATSTCISSVYQAMRFPARTSGGSVTVTHALTFDLIPVSDRSAPGSDKVAWTPFAIGAFAPERAATVARASESAVRSKTDKLEACFAKKGVMGSLRAVLGVHGDGNVTAVRAGGLGDGVIEACVEKELLGTKVVNPSGTPTEIACDFARGDALPWRVTAADGYSVITATRKEMRFGQLAIPIGALEPETLPKEATYLIIAEPETPGSVLTSALAWASEGDASLVALADGQISPRYLGMAKIGHDDQLSSRPMMLLGRKSVQACLGKQTREGKVSEAGQLAIKLAARCKTMRCGSLVVGIDDLALAKDLVEITGAARRAGFDRVVIGGRLACEKVMDFEDDES